MSSKSSKSVTLPWSSKIKEASVNEAGDKADHGGTKNKAASRKEAEEAQKNSNKNTREWRTSLPPGINLSSLPAKEAHG